MGLSMDFAFHLPVTILREGKRFVAYSPALDLSTSGTTFAQAQRRFIEAAHLFFEELADKGTTEIVLADLGWEKVRRKWQAPTLVSQTTETISVPAAI